MRERSVTLHVLAIPGSLRTASINAAFCRVVANCAPTAMSVAIHPRLGDIPLFNPDLESAPPAPALELRLAILRADAAVCQAAQQILAAIFPVASCTP